MKNDFSDVKQSPVKTSKGVIDFPIIYRKVNGVFASFWTDFKAAEKKLEGTGCKPVYRPFSNKKKAMATVAFFEYLDCSAGLYNEVAVSVHCVPEKSGYSDSMSPFDFLSNGDRKKTGTYITDLPVTTDWAVAGGVEVYGYPKWLADIRYDFSDNFMAVIGNPSDGKTAVSFSGRFKGFAVKMSCPDVLSYSVLNGKMLRTVIQTSGKWKNYRGSGFMLKAESDHYSAENIRDLGLDRAVPFLVQRTVDFRSVLPLGTVI